MLEQALKNRLAETTSPYLLQHAENPVAWQPWDDQALAAARALRRPILLSSGYSTCHWCHVMAHESFEDEETAALMNASFVNIKLDREERPDLDMIYQTAHSLLTQRHGGWPLTAFLSERTLQAFFCGTYFPDTPRHNLPSFKDVLRAVAQHHKNKAHEVEQVGAQVQHALRSIYTLQRETVDLPDDLARRARDRLLAIVDRVHGGFGDEPKFPQPALLRCLLRQWLGEDARDDETMASALRLTFASICRCGLYDHVGGGFFRYCVDAKWTIPHFEKMLYDNGQLLELLADARDLLEEKHFTDIAIQTAQWMAREMQAQEGAYYCAVDADSPNGEGDYYVWTPAEIEDIVGASGAADIAHRFGDGAPNFEGRKHLNIQTLAAPDGVDAATFDAALARHLEALRQHRAKRVAPATDNKHLTAWNALAIKGMAKVARAFDYAPARESAERALDCIRHALWRDGRLHGGMCRGVPYEKAFLNDYAFLIDAVLELLQHRWRSDDLTWAIDLAEQLLERFEDAERGGYYFTADADGDAALQRPVTFYDDALPSGYGVAALTLARLGHLCGEARFSDSAERAIARASSVLSQSPAECATLLHAYEERLTPPTIVIIRADDSSEAWRRAATKKSDAHRLAFVIPADAPRLPEAIAMRAASPTEELAYVCVGTSCREPVASPAALERLLDDSSI